MRAELTTTRPRCELRWLDLRILLVEYRGRIPADDPNAKRIEEMVSVAREKVALCYDLTHLESFDRSQVSVHGQALSHIAHRVAGIAIIGARPAARFAAVTVSLMSRIPLATFEYRSDATTWLESHFR